MSFNCDGLPNLPYAAQNPTQNNTIEFRSFDKLVDLIHAASGKAVIIATGGGAEVLGMLTRRGGASSTLLTAILPWTEAETHDLLGGIPDKLVSEETARSLAMAAFQRGLKLRTEEEPVIGVAITCILQRVPEERLGREHWIYAALQTTTRTVSWRLNMDWGSAEDSPVGVRCMEECLAAYFVLNVLAEGFDLQQRIHNPQDDRVVRTESNIPAEISELFNGKRNSLAIDCMLINDDECQLHAVTTAERPKILFPGSFNPIHLVHEEIYNSHAANDDVAFEISIQNVDKPYTDLIDLCQRLKKIATPGGRRVWITTIPTFAGKAEAFPDATFLVGFDTASRINDPKYGNLADVYRIFETYNTKFVVFERGINNFKNLPTQFKRRATLSDYVKIGMAMSEISSSQIRRNNRL